MQNLNEIQSVLSQAQAGVKAQAEAEGWIGELYHALAAPVIVWPGYEDDFADKKQQVVVDRLARLSKGDRERATDLEVALYCSSASFVNPMPENYVHIYEHAFRKVYGDAKADEIGIEGKELDPWTEKPEYDRLAKWIYAQQEKHLKERKAQ